MLSVVDTSAAPDAPPPCPAPFNLAEHVLSAGQSTPDKIALSILGVSGAERWSYARLTSAVLGTASGLLQSGLTPGACVLMRLGNSVDFPIVYLGAIAAGLVPVPTSSQLTASEVARMIPELQPAAILHGANTPLPNTDFPVFGENEIRAWRDLPPAPFHRGDPERLAYIVYTSGTSGQPRAVCHAHRAIWARQMMMRDWYHITSHDRVLHAGAFNWTFTLGTGLMDPWTAGATALVPKDGTRPEQLPLLLKRNDATLFAAVPGIYRKLLKAPLPALPKLRHCLSAGEKLPDGMRQEWRAASGTEIYEAFGMSECSTFISSSPDRPAAEGCLGTPQTGRRVALIDKGEIVAAGKEGTIAVHRSDPGLMLGYLGDPGFTAERFSGDWFLTGDRAVLRPDGQLRFVGRDDDMMNAGGFRVSPLEVEKALADIAGISEIAVTEITVKADVRVIAAFYHSAGPVDTDWLRAEAAQRLAGYKQPRIFQWVAALPRNPNGKLNRKALAPLLKPDPA